MREHYGIRAGITSLPALASNLISPSLVHMAMKRKRWKKIRGTSLPQIY